MGEVSVLRPYEDGPADNADKEGCERINFGFDSIIPVGVRESDAKASGYSTEEGRDILWNF